METIPQNVHSNVAISHTFYGHVAETENVLLVRRLRKRFEASPLPLADSGPDFFPVHLNELKMNLSVFFCF